ncbi:ABC transporter permease [Verminephrobacter eiseniae]|uniref:ABC transporter permease n=1 Tax=Verminephrobacter eiseniae TaxID=364317 RepID=UPI0010E94C7E|nr:ABC transporter permease [Verminephrobacter eiseniae]KAB7609810.1 ABC transporter permease [Verminephrobacter sp. Larva24]MCW5233743.1 ABC transporter permease [Verminephrobacter eiseniae]MCW5261863.1 ABC transporter permease [Verminephrobacter eiseniae]MCW5294703.1 ABC transporter permease [Verminephrobacter eiseniae]MCW8185517.1 ABC transporter permease [Verminephrobacter eiseniae]
MSDLNTSLKAKLGGNAPFIALVALYLLIEIAQPGFFAPSTQLGLLADSSTLFIMAAGTTFVVLIGSIDLSLQAVASLSSVIVALLLPRHGALAAVVALAASFGVGLLSGIIQTALRIPSFIATLAVGGIASAAALTLSGTRSIGIGQEMRSASLGWTTGTSLGVPHEILLGIAVFAFCLFLHRSTVFGRHTDAIGAGEPAAIASGLRVPVTKCLVFATSSFFAGLAGVVMAGRLGSGSPTLADQFLLPVIAAVIVGGTALTGGSGGIARTLVGALLVSVARVGMTFVGISVFAQQIVFGLILIVAVTIAFDRSKVLIVK